MRLRTSFRFVPVLALLAVPLAAQETKESPKAPEEGQTITLQVGVDKELLTEFAADLKEAVQPEGAVVARINEQADRHPFTGIGITLEADVRTDADDEPVSYAARIGGVYKGSPADTAGVKPGDWVLAVNGQAVSEVPAKDATWESVGALTRTVADLVSAADDTVQFRIGRGDSRFTFHLHKVLIGSEVRGYLDANRALWTAYLAGLEPEAEAYAAKVAKAGEDQAELQALFEEGRELNRRIVKPLENVRDFLDSLLIK